MLEYSKAIEIINSYKGIIFPGSALLPISECMGMTLADDVRADVDFPSFTNSAMDGYAVKFIEDKRKWEISGEISAGNFSGNISIGNKAVRITTGGKLPFDADSVIPLEDVDVSENEITLRDGIRVNTGNQVRLKGEYLASNSVAIEKGTVLEPNQLTLAAACGCSLLSVLQPLKIAVLSTGDELVPFNCKPENDQVRATNSFSLAMLIKNYGLVPIPIENASDNKSDIKNKIETALGTGCDILVTSGGVSVGRHDYVKDVLINMGAEIIFWKVNVKPGKPFLFSHFHVGNRTIPVFSLPGNPVSAFVNFLIFLKPYLDKIYNRKTEYINGVLKQEIKKSDSRLHFVLANYNYDQISGEFRISAVGEQSSGDIVSLGRCNCLVLFSAELKKLRKGEVVQCLKI